MYKTETGLGTSKTNLRLQKKKKEEEGWTKTGIMPHTLMCAQQVIRKDTQSCTENPTEHTFQSKNRYTSTYIWIKFLDT